ncbi:MAG: hypothetical protein OCD02_13625 [Spirochaetaceae bacterium]
MRKYLFLILITLKLSVFLFSSDNTDNMLDQSIDEFSKKNYQEALIIIDEVLVMEPDNSTALMYKKTIEDVISIDNEESKTSDLENNNSSETIDSEILPNVTDEEINVKDDLDFISLTTIIGKDDNEKLILESGLKVNLGLPVIELKLTSYDLGLDITSIDLDISAASDIFDIDNYFFNLSIGARYNLFKNLGINGGYFDINIGARNFIENDNEVVPFLGFDTEIYFLTILGNKSILNNLWIGGSGSLYNFDGDFIDNYSLEFKAGVTLGFLDLGWIYATDITNAQYTGIMASINF